MTERRVKAVQTAQLLTEAKAAISDRSKWIKGSLAEYNRREAYHDVQEQLLNASRMCAIGVVYHTAAKRGVWHSKERRIAEQHLRDVSHFVNGADVEDFNDRSATTHADVMALFDLAIEEQCKIVREESAKDDPNFPDQG